MAYYEIFIFRAINLWYIHQWFTGIERCHPSIFNHLFSCQSRGGVSYMVSICGQNVHSCQHLLARPGVRHDASGQSLRHGATQHVRPEERLRPGYVRQRARNKGGTCIYVEMCIHVQVLHVLCALCLSGFRSSLACWWHLQTGISTFIMWIHKMEASVSLSKNTGVCVCVPCLN